MTLLRAINIAAWLIVLAYMAVSVIAIYRGKAGTGDPSRLVYAAFSALVIGYNLRFVLIPESRSVQAALQLLSIGVALYACLVARASGRGRSDG